MLSGDNEEVTQPFPLQIVPNPLYSCQMNWEERRIVMVEKNRSQWKANLSSLQHLKTTTAAATGINISGHIQVSMAALAPHFTFGIQMGVVAGWPSLLTTQLCQIDPKMKLLWTVRRHFHQEPRSCCLQRASRLTDC